MMFVRLRQGIVSHFHVRATEWAMVYPCIGMWIVYTIQPDMMTVSPSFDALERWASGRTWATMVLVCAVVRILALSINGTFHRVFPWTPHIRVFAASLSLFFWSQFTLGFFATFISGSGAGSAVIMYSFACLLEFLNIYRGFSDIGASRGMRNGRTG